MRCGNAVRNEVQQCGQLGYVTRQVLIHRRQGQASRETRSDVEHAASGSMHADSLMAKGPHPGTAFAARCSRVHLMDGRVYSLLP